ncbi:MAG: MiaB/RimO family radical SAM methylthiotransferase [Chloroflexi bacterium]|jgi:threonylcarbamoyladenosine tRNA methylthiotransferase MtaB|nr:MiaB/RimO family radical SAM methylthiotransferase [Chloroflexota bacterium]
MLVYLESLGCRLNAAEIETLARHFAGAGCSVVDAPEAADVIVFNSCAVTVAAARKTRQRLRQFHRQNPGARIAVTGCWATEDGARAGAFEGVAWVIPNEEKYRLPARVMGRQPPLEAPLPWSPGRWGHTRAFLAVQDGCDHACTYCVTRLLRGPARSRPPAEVVAEARGMLAHGAREIVLTGVSLGAYGQDFRDLDEAYSLAHLAASILDEMTHVEAQPGTQRPRLRLSSVEPWDVDARLLHLLEHPRFCRQLHLPLQSGADATLKRMGRRITASQFAALTEQARAIAPDVALTTDVIVGFPGEGAAEFEASLAFVERMAFSRLHVFPYSERAGTAAIKLPDAISPRVRKRRAARMRALGQRLAAAYREHFVGATLPVLWERQDARGRWRGWTDTYIAVVTRTPTDLYNRITPTKLVGESGRAMRGEVVSA